MALMIDQMGTYRVQGAPRPMVFEVTDIWNSLPEGPEWNDHAAGLLRTTPAVAPFNHTWWEWVADTTELRREYAIAAPGKKMPLVRSGVELVTLTAGDVMKAYDRYVKGAKARQHEIMTALKESIELGAAQWQFGMAYGQAGDSFYDVSSFTVALDADGKMIKTGDGFFIFGRMLDDDQPEHPAYPGMTRQDRENETIVQCAWQTSYMCAMTHVRNVIQDEHVHDARLQKARQRKGREPFHDYRTLRVVTPRQAHAYAQGDRTAVKGVMPAHVVMGHYTHYKDEDGHRLFGKWTGTYWMPAHTRGSKAVGVVEKDYKLVEARQ